MKFFGYGITDRGLFRTNNEDSFVVDDALGLYVVCDGIGGCSAGELASAEAIRAIQEFFESHQRELRDITQRGNAENLEQLVRQSISYASKALILAAVRDEFADMGTTLTMLFVSGNQGVVANVGDSRAYLIRDCLAKQMTVDHTLGQELLASGCSAGTAKSFNHVLTRAVRVQDTALIDTFVIDFEVGDRILLCSDGLSNYFVDDYELASLVAESGDMPALPQLLVDLANARGGRDNITAIIVGVDG